MDVKTVRIQRVLDHYFPAPPVPLNCRSDFTFLVSVVLSAQTTDGKVNQVTEELFKLASTPKELAALSPSVVEQIIRPVGLANSKANNIVKLSQRLVDAFDGKVPNNYDDLESLAGVGHKTASVVMSQIFDVPAIAVDTHVHRLALRWGLSKEQNNVNKVQQDLCDKFPEKSWNKLHLQMIYFGRQFCSAKGHENAQCPMCSWVHKANVDESCFSPAHLDSFVAQPKTKGIVYYDDRMSQLAENSTDYMKTMNLNSPIKYSAKLKIEDVAVVVSGKNDFSAFAAEGVEPPAAPASGRKKRRTK